MHPRAGSKRVSTPNLPLASLHPVAPFSLSLTPSRPFVAPDAAENYADGGEKLW